MADVSRSYADLIALLADGQNRGVSAQDMRDVLKSLRQPFMGLYWSTPAATVISGSGTYTKALGTTTLTHKSDDMDDGGASNRMRFIGASPRHFHIVAQATVQFGSGSNQTVGLQVYHWDDSAGSGALIHPDARNTISGTSLEQITSHTDVMLDTNDYLELHVANHTNANDFTVQLGYVFGVGMLM